MKVLLDENLPHQMRQELTGHHVFTTVYMGWGGVENGELLRLAVAAGFEVLITNDRGLEYQQDLANLPLAVIVVLAPSNTIESLRPIFPAILKALADIRPCEFIKVTMQ